MMDATFDEKKFGPTLTFRPSLAVFRFFGGSGPPILKNFVIVKVLGSIWFILQHLFTTSWGIYG